MDSVWYFVTLLCFTSCAAQHLEWDSKDGQIQKRMQDKELQEFPNMQTFLEMLSKLSKFENGIEHQDPDEMEKEKKSGRMWNNRCSFFFWKTWAIC